MEINIKELSDVLLGAYIENMLYGDSVSVYMHKGTYSTSYHNGAEEIYSFAPTDWDVLEAFYDVYSYVEMVSESSGKNIPVPQQMPEDNDEDYNSRLLAHVAENYTDAEIKDVTIAVIKEIWKNDRERIVDRAIEYIEIFGEVEE